MAHGPVQQACPCQKQGVDSKHYEQLIERFQGALEDIFGEKVGLGVDLDPEPNLRVNFRGQRLNFSQLPDGVRSTIGWTADFMMRRDRDGSAGQDAILLLDEADAHLHPKWQRRLLPAMQRALPGVQIIAGTHSPFVISSCPGARIHLLDIDDQGHAFHRETMDAPIGDSIAATIRDIFDFKTRFPNAEVERGLQDWARLKEREALWCTPAGMLTPEEQNDLRTLTESLAQKGEELRLVVSTPPKLSKSLVEALTKR